MISIVFFSLEVKTYLELYRADIRVYFPNLQIYLTK